MKLEKLPEGPDDMPAEFLHENPNWLRNTLVTLNEFSVVDIHFENDWSQSNRTGEPSGEWEVTIETAHRKRIASKHEDIENALWYADTVARSVESDDWKKRDAEKHAALSKLTTEERRILGLR